MVQEGDKIRDVFCSVCGRSLDELSPYGNVTAYIGKRVRDRQCVIKSSEQEDGRVYVALKDPMSPEAARLEEDMRESDEIFTVKSTDGGLVLTPNLMVGVCECGQRTIVEADGVVDDRHVTDDYVAALKILTHFVDETDREIVEDLVNSFDYPERVKSIIENPMVDDEFERAVHWLRMSKESESYVPNNGFCMNLDGSYFENLTNELRSDEDWVSPYGNMELKSTSFESDSTSTDKDGEDTESNDLEKDYARMFGDPSESMSLEADLVTTSLDGYTIEVDDDGVYHLLDEDGDEVYQITGDGDNFVTVDKNEFEAMTEDQKEALKEGLKE